MKASVNGREFEDVSYNGLVAKIVAAVGKHRPPAQERINAARAMERGHSVVIAGVLIKPEGSRE